MIYCSRLYKKTINIYAVYTVGVIKYEYQLSNYLHVAELSFIGGDKNLISTERNIM